MENDPKGPHGLYLSTYVHCSSADLHQVKPLNYDGWTMVDEPTTN